MVARLVQRGVKKLRAAELEQRQSDQTAPTTEAEPIQPYSLLRVNQAVQTVREQAALSCRLSTDQIQDVLPCTPLQEGLLAMTTKLTGEYVVRNVHLLQDGVDAELFSKAWIKVAMENAILRTRIVDLPDQGLVQVVIHTAPPCTNLQGNLRNYVQTDEARNMGLGEPLTWAAIITNGNDGARYFVWTIHHALYDGWSMTLLLDQLENAYLTTDSPALLPFRGFIKHITSLDSEVTARFWKSKFDGCEAATFPALPSPLYQPQASQLLEHTITGFQWPRTDIKPTTILRAAWAIVINRHTSSNDVAFGAISNGRRVPVPGIKRMAGPTMATMPVRVKMQDEGLVGNLLSDMQSEAVEMMPHEQWGLSNIRKLGPGAEQACQFQSIFVVQPKAKHITNRHSRLFVKKQSDGAAGDRISREYFTTYALIVICQLTDHGVDIEIRYDTAVVGSSAALLVQQFDQVLRQLCQPNTFYMAINEIETTRDQDLRQIWAWNAAVPETVEACVHNNLFANHVRQQPYAPAICAWDGELTYGELDVLSTRLAHRLAALGARPGTIVPLCFEKSMWTPVAMLAVMKAGAASVAMDTTQPASRLRAIVQQTLSHSSHCQLILSSEANQGLAGDLVSRMAGNVPVLTVNKEAAQDLENSNSHPPLVQATPDDLLCVVFTSGSTGVPKGVMLTHANFSSAIKYQQDLPLISRYSRVLDFASYAFDAAWHNLLCSLAVGATLCVPDQEERLADLSGAIQRYNADYVLLPPTAARLLGESSLTRLKTVVLGGEVVLASDATIWNKAANAFNIYGPAECTVLSTVQRLDVGFTGSPSIGRGCGTVVWVVRPDGKSLVSIGEIGELWIEGPLVGRGYLGEPDKTAAAFVEDPAWLVAGGPTPGSSGRRGRLYRTGDLVRYDSDGVLHFVGRKDDQVKIRGQRVELGEIEHHLKECLAAYADTYADINVVVDVIRPAGSETAILVAFLASGNAAENNATLTVERIMADIDASLGDRLPAHMVPGAYVTVEKIPMTTTGKADRLRLREIGAAMTLEQLAALNVTRSQGGGRTAPATEAELQLQRLWAGVLGISLDSIAAEDSFLRIGGDSVAAMRLVGRAREQGLSLKVTDVFRSPRLRDLAWRMATGNSNAEPITPFSLLSVEQPIDVIRKQAALLCRVTTDQIEDVFPCTPLQEGLLAMTAKKAGEYVARNILLLHDDVDIKGLAEAWNKVTAANDILRTYIVDLPEQGLVQVVLRTASPCIVRQSLIDDYTETDKAQEIGLGKSLSQFSIVVDVKDGARYLVWTIHHALYDGWSMPLLLKQLEGAYSGNIGSCPMPFQSFIKYIASLDSQSTVRFWQAQLADCEATPFPPLPSSSQQPQADQLLRHTIADVDWSQTQTDTTLSTILRAAWAVVVSRHTASNDVSFGAVSNGRQAPVPGIEHMTGPTIATVPVRVKLQGSATDLLASMQSQAVDMVPHEQFGLSRIRKLGSGAEQACRFQSILVMQPKEEAFLDQNVTLFSKNERNTAGLGSNVGQFVTYALMVTCQLDSRGIKVELRYDATVVGSSLAALLAQQFDQVIRQLCLPDISDMALDEIETTSQGDLQQIWTWNAAVPETIEACVHDLFTKRARQQPHAPAICAWDGKLTYGELDALSTRLAHRLARVGAMPGTIIPLCFEKSLWTSVAMLAVMKAGAASVAMDTTQPESRLRAIVQQTFSHSNSPLIMSSEANQALAGELVREMATDIPIVVVGDKEAAQHSGDGDSHPLARAAPDDLLYVVFTSGSTGIPKGAMITHANFS
ncbi:acetyl-CoA synthetase-like protein, partial [Colletotrichum somersetense]